MLIQIIFWFLLPLRLIKSPFLEGTFSLSFFFSLFFFIFLTQNRTAGWIDHDGTVTNRFPGERTNIGSDWAGPDWWYDFSAIYDNYSLAI